MIVKNRCNLTQAPDFEYIIPLREILAELHGAGVESKKVTAAFIEAINFAGNEFTLLIGNAFGRYLCVAAAPGGRYKANAKWGSKAHSRL